MHVIAASSAPIFIAIMIVPLILVFAWLPSQFAKTGAQRMLNLLCAFVFALGAAFAAAVIRNPQRNSLDTDWDFYFYFAAVLLGGALGVLVSRVGWKVIAGLSRQKPADIEQSETNAE